MRRFLIHYMQKYKSKVIGCLFLMVILSILSNVTPYLIKIIVDIGIPRGDFGYIINLIIITAIVFVLYSIGNFVFTFIFTEISENINLDIKKDTYKKMMFYPMSFFNSKEKGYILARTREINLIKPLFSSNTCKLLLAGIEFVFAFVIIFSINRTFALIIYCFLNISRHRHQ